MEYENWEHIIKEFAPISLAEMKSVTLMNRVDTKYITTPQGLSAFLRDMQSQYYIQEASGFRNSHYFTVYFDTEQLDMYMAHQDGHATREKIRMRSYIDSGLSFLEVKDKSNRGRTNKKRMRLPEADDPEMERRTAAFLEQYAAYNPALLRQQVSNRFERMTLVDRAMTERLTIDTNIQFRNPRTQAESALPELVIIELKQDSLSESFAKERLRALHIHPAKISKYCLGAILTHPDLKCNCFKRRLMYMNKIINTEQWIY